MMKLVLVFYCPDSVRAVMPHGKFIFTSPRMAQHKKSQREIFNKGKNALRSGRYFSESFHALLQCQSWGIALFQ